MSAASGWKREPNPGLSGTYRYRRNGVTVWPLLSSIDLSGRVRPRVSSWVVEDAAGAEIGHARLLRNAIHEGDVHLAAQARQGGAA